jgi:hypothetical protein
MFASILRRLLLSKTKNIKEICIAMQISILIRLNYVPKIFQKQDLAVAKAIVVVVSAQRLL